MRDFRFTLDPAEDIDDYCARWDAELLKLQSTGYTIKGNGPDGDEPVHTYLADEEDPLGPIVQVYLIVPLEKPLRDRIADRITEARAKHAAPDANLLADAILAIVEPVVRQAKADAFDEGYGLASSPAMVPANPYRETVLV